VDWAVPYHAVVLVRRLAAMTWSLILAACAGAGSSEPPSSASAATASQAGGSAEGEVISAFDLEIGNCFDTPEPTLVEEVERIDCASPHTYEVYAAPLHPAANNAPYPGDEPLATFAEDECIAAFEPFVGLDYDSSELFIFYLQPTDETWSVGDREVLCSVHLEDEPLVGSMEASER
jgi:hypothetical protein